MSTSTKKTTGRSAIQDVVAREYTIHLHKRVFGMQFKKRAPRAVKEIKKFAFQAMVRCVNYARLLGPFSDSQSCSVVQQRNERYKKKKKSTGRRE